ncbi:MAG TPA: hypothetical protein VFE46_07525 [Pirellulales bacterium]|nr:hypothetical protein [Pirellulales bacterium]
MSHTRRQTSANFQSRIGLGGDSFHTFVAKEKIHGKKDFARNLHTINRTRIAFRRMKKPPVDGDRGAERAHHVAHLSCISQLPISDSLH